MPARQVLERSRNDLAVLLSERFEAPSAASPAPAPRTTPPMPPNETFGRAKDIEHVAALIRDGTRVVTLTVPAGSERRASRWRPRGPLRTAFAGGVHLVDLAPVTDPASVLRVVADRVSVAAHRGARAAALPRPCPRSGRARRYFTLVDRNGDRRSPCP